VYGWPSGPVGREITVTGEPVGGDAALARTLAAAAVVLHQHVPDVEGWCLGCLALWGRLVLIEQCTQRRWAAAVQAAYGGEGPASPG
jgi:hypothetical protein